MSRSKKNNEQKGLRIERYFTKEGVSAYDMFTYDYRTSVIKNPNGSVDGIEGITRDITKIKTSEEENKRLEEQLQHKSKMDTLGQLTGGVAHDFNNILSGMFGYSQLAEMNIDNMDKVKNNLHQINKGVTRASDLIQQILTFSRQTEHKKKPIKLYRIYYLLT